MTCFNRNKLSLLGTAVAVSGLVLAAGSAAAGSSDSSSLCRTGSSSLGSSLGCSGTFASSITLYQSQAATTTTIRNVFGAISQSIDKRFASKSTKRTDLGSGLAAGDADNGLSAWLSQGYTNLRVYPDGNNAQRNITDLASTTAGIDKKFSDKIVAGVSFAYNHGELDGHNVDTSKLTQTSNAYSLVPYIGITPLPNLLVSGMAGATFTDFGNSDYLNNRYGTGDNDGRTLFTAWKVAYDVDLKAVTARPFASFSYQNNRVTGYTLTNGDVISSQNKGHWQFDIGSQVAYQIKDVNLYGSAAYERDQSLAAVGENSARLGVGFDMPVWNTLSVGADLSANVGRDSQQEYGGTVNGRLAF